MGPYGSQNFKRYIPTVSIRSDFLIRAKIMVVMREYKSIDILSICQKLKFWGTLKF